MRIYYIGSLMNNTYYITPHYHNCWEIVYYTQGDGNVNINGKIIPFETNDIFAIPPGVPHFDYSDHGFQNYHYNFIDEEFTQQSYLKFHDSEGHDFLNALRQMHNEYHLKRENWERIVDSLYEVLKNYIYSFSKSSTVNPYVSGFITVIIDNISNRDFSIKDEINKIPLNPDYFKKLFTSVTGKSPLGYLMWKRMLYARQLLSSQSVSHLSIKEISWMCGYDNYYYFSRQFKKCFGLSPRIWVKAAESQLPADADEVNIVIDDEDEET